VATKCPKCQADNPETSRFCGNCATALTPGDQPPALIKTLGSPAHILSEGSLVAGKYRIIKEIGRGGMGEVYLALDTTLGRKVALKILPPEFSSDKDRLKRFQKEAKAASALSHPNIAHIYEIGAEREHHFISMEYIEGRTVSAEIADGPLETGKLLEMAIQIADALHEAHAKGIIHRDIKPENIVLAVSGRPVILDFGLAKVLPPDDLAEVATLSVTVPGAVFGTVPYMSPEQVRGLDVDHRTDLFSFGVLLYEMATGRPAFARQTTAETIEQILLHQPEAVARFNYSVPAELDRIIRKCLEKDREGRYQSAQEILIDLRRLQSDLRSPEAVAVDGSKPSIVVLPFEDFSPAKDNEYFSAGLTDEIITDLSQIEQLRVISRTSAMALKGKARNVKTIARELNVKYVLQGSVRKAGNKLRITAQLVDAVDDTLLWATKLNGTLNQVFDIQEEVSRAVLQAFNVRLTPEQNKGLVDRPIQDPHAYESYLRARYAIWSWTPDAFAEAERDLQKSLELQGENELLYATLGWVRVMSVEAGLQNEEFLEKAEECSRAVLRLSPVSPYASSLQGVIEYKRGNIQAAVVHLKRANMLIKNNPEILGSLSYCYCLAGRQSIARPLVENLLQVDPLTGMNYAVRGFLEFLDGRPDRAIDYYRKAFELGRGIPVLSLFLAWILAADGQKAEAGKVIDMLKAKAGETLFSRFGEILNFALQGNRDGMLAALTPEIQEAARQVEYFSRLLADCCALVGADAEAIHWLENDIRLGFFNYPFLSRSPFLSELKGNRQFDKILERARFLWTHFQE